MSKKTENLRDIVKILSRTDLESLILARLPDDPALETLILTRHAKSKSTAMFDRLIDLAFSRIDDNGSYGYSDLCDTVFELGKIAKTAHDARREGDVALAVRVLCRLTERAAAQSIEGDDHDGNLMSFVNACFDDLSAIATSRKTGSSALANLRSWAESAMREPWAASGDSWDESCREILSLSARGAAELRAELERAVMLSNAKGDDWNTRYRAKHATLSAIGLFARLKDAAGREKFIMDRIHEPVIRLLAIDEAIKNGNPERAKMLATEGLRLANKNESRSGGDELATRLIRVHRILGDGEAAGNVELERFFATWSMETWYKQIKKRHKTDWLEFRMHLIEKVVNLHPGPGILASIYAAEDMPEKLLEICRTDTFVFKNHYRALGKRYPEVVSDWMRKNIEKDCERPHSRSGYEELADRIAEYTAYTSAQAAQELAGNLIQKYSNRPAMREVFTRKINRLDKPERKKRTD